MIKNTKNRLHWLRHQQKDIRIYLCMYYSASNIGSTRQEIIKEHRKCKKKKYESTSVNGGEITRDTERAVKRFFEHKKKKYIARCMNALGWGTICRWIKNNCSIILLSPHPINKCATEFTHLYPVTVWLGWEDVEGDTACPLEPKDDQMLFMRR